MQIELEQHIDAVFRFALSLSRDRHLAEDLTQECFLKAQLRVSQLQKKSDAKGWLFQILVNLWKDHLKKKLRAKPWSGDLNPISKELPADRVQVQQEDLNRIILLMQTLPEQQRTVLFLKCVEGFSNSEIARLIGKTENAVKANLSIARKTMREKVAGCKTNE